MNSLKKKILFVLTSVTLCFAALSFSYSEMKKKTTPIDDSVSSSVEANENKTPIIIYNSHPDEEYPFGQNVIEVGKVLSNNLKSQGLDSNFIEVASPSSYIEAYNNSRNTIINKVENYDKSILLDVHRQASENSNLNNRSILIVLAKANPNYESCKTLADSLIKEINEASEIKASIHEFDKGFNYFNQDLSQNSLIVEIGNQNSTVEDVNACIKALTPALKKVTSF